jgi:Ca-activated chloride channel family protein
MKAPSGAFPPDSITERGRRWAALAACLLGAGLAAPPADAQFRSGVNVVEVYASVLDAKGEPVVGLTREQFVVREDGVPQEVSAFAAGEFPLAVAVALDHSFSMKGDRLVTAVAAARAFLGQLRPSDQSMLIGIGSQTEVLAPLSSDRAAQYGVLDGLDAFGTTGLHDAILASIDAVQPARGRRALVILSDGDDRYSRASAADALQRARASDVLVYAVALGRTRPPRFAELASLTGGRSFHVRDARRLPETLQTIARELRHQYLLGYSPSRPIGEGEGEWRSIAVTVRQPGATVRARDGYVAR